MNKNEIIMHVINPMCTKMMNQLNAMADMINAVAILVQQSIPNDVVPTPQPTETPTSPALSVVEDAPHIPAAPGHPAA